VNAALKQRAGEIEREQTTLRDQLHIAQMERDYWKGKNQAEREHWEGRIQAIESELRIQQSCLRVVMPGDGGPDEQRRLAAKEDSKRERDEYA
jgi:hypothetical protein